MTPTEDFIITIRKCCKVGFWLEGAAAEKSHEKDIKCAVEQSGINMD